MIVPVPVKKIIIAVLGLVWVASIAVSVWALFFRDKAEILPPDYPPRETEAYQEPIPDDTGSSMDASSGGGTVSLSYSDTIRIDLSEGQASLLYANPSRSNQNVAIAVLIRDTVILRSGVINPGNRVRRLDLEEDAGELLQVGRYDARLVVYFYHPETGEKAMLDAAVEITVEVTE